MNYKCNTMKLYIKYMVSDRCKMAVKEELKKSDLHFKLLDLGEVEIMEDISAIQRDQLKTALFKIGFELMDDRKNILVEKIKNIIIEMVHFTDKPLNTNFSDYLSSKLNYDYNYLSNLFSEIRGTNIESFIIAHKIERIKELLMYGELNLTQISYKLNYSSVAHLSNQFKKSTGLSPSFFKKLKNKKRMALENV